MSHVAGTHEAALRLVLGVDPLPSDADALPLRGKRVLDIGAGSAPWPWVQDRHVWCEGLSTLITVDLPGIESPHGDAHIEADVAEPGWSRDLRHLARFDVAVAVEVLEHLENPTQLLRDIEPLLAPGGMVLVTSPNCESEYARQGYATGGWFPYFDPGAVRGHSSTGDDHGHITPIFSWLLEEMCRRVGLRIVAHAHNEPADVFSPEELAGMHELVNVWRLERV